MKKKNNHDEGLSMFSGFWKYVGMMGTFFLGAFLCISGAQLLMYDGNFFGAFQLAVGFALGIFSSAEFFKAIKN